MTCLAAKLDTWVQIEYHLCLVLSMIAQAIGLNWYTLVSASRRSYHFANVSVLHVQEQPNNQNVV